MRRAVLKQRMQKRLSLAEYLSTRRFREALIKKPSFFLQALGLARPIKFSKAVQSEPREDLTTVVPAAHAARKAHLEEVMSDPQIEVNTGDDTALEGEGSPRANVGARIEKSTAETKRRLPLNVSQTPTPKPPVLNVGPEDRSKPIVELEPEGDSPGDTTQDGSAEIFAKADESDRSPLAWLARLVEAAKPQPDAQPIKQSRSIASTTSDRRPAAAVNALRSGSQHRSFRPLAPVEQPLILPQATRRFLKPLVGIDPASVPIYAGASAAQLASNNQADALTIAEVVALGPGYVSETPEQLGVLAHELTHIARQRQPRFVPPIARQVPAQSSGTVALETMDEEVLARKVEARVIRAAKAADDRDSSSVSTESLLPPHEIENAPFRSESSVPARDWGGLPAPWEPLPNWMNAPASESIISVSAPVTTSTAESVLAAASSSLSQVAAVQHAADGRTLDDDSSSEPARMHEVQAAESVKQVEPDLDAMAQQVYSILKRRLVAERRRESC